MAIIGATTMNMDFFESHGLGSSIWNNGPLDTQIQWFQQLMPSICGSASGECLWPSSTKLDQLSWHNIF